MVNAKWPCRDEVGQIPFGRLDVSLDARVTVVSIQTSSLLGLCAYTLRTPESIRLQRSTSAANIARVEQISAAVPCVCV